MVESKLKILTPTVRGVIHVGTNWGEEIPAYLAMGATHVLGFEPGDKAFKAARDFIKDPRVKLYNVGLGAETGLRIFREIDDPNKMPGHPVGTGGSSFLEEVIPPEGCTLTKYGAVVWRFDEFLRRRSALKIEDYDALVVDVQGMELEVLKGFGSLLEHINYANIECSAEPVYKGEAPASEVINYLAQYGLVARTPIEQHNDILFSR